MLVHKSLEPFISVNVLLDGDHLVAGYVFGEVAAVLAVLEVVVGLAVRPVRMMDRWPRSMRVMAANCLMRSGIALVFMG